MKKVIITIIISILSVCGIGGFKIVNNQSKENAISKLQEIQIENTTDENYINEEIVIPIEDDENKTSTIEETPPSEAEINNYTEEKVIIPEQNEIKESVSKPKKSNNTSNDKKNTSSNQDNNKHTSESEQTSTSSNNDSLTSNSTAATPQNTSQQEIIKDESPKEDVPKTETPVRCTDNYNHGVGVGNSNKWFNSKQEAINYFDGIQKTWGEKWERFEIDSETYDKHCPYGYEVWSCPFCGKWTINFYYR